MNKILRSKFDLFSEWIADSLGKPVAFVLALSSVFLWAAWGPFAGFSQTWQLIINTGTTIATFLMVFLLQNTQNRDTEEMKEILREVRQNQRALLQVQRKMNERIMTLEYELDAKRHSA
jgi:low affinity Fe/Cu permease